MAEAMAIECKHPSLFFAREKLVIRALASGSTEFNQVLPCLTPLSVGLITTTAPIAGVARLQAVIAVRSLLRSARKPEPSRSLCKASGAD